MSFELQLVFHCALSGFFLPSQLRGKVPIVREIREKTSVKDVIEACGVPHPEVDLIAVSCPNGEICSGVDFRWQLEYPIRLDVYGFPLPLDFFPSAPRLKTLCFD